MGPSPLVIDTVDNSGQPVSPRIMLDQMIYALKARFNLFTYGGQLHEVITDGDATKLEVVTPRRLASLLAWSVEIRTPTKKNSRLASPAPDQRMAIMGCASDWAQPIESIIRVPHYRWGPDPVTSERSVRPVREAGYDQLSRSFSAFDGHLPTVTPALREEVLDRLLNFPFVGPSDRQHALALLLQPILRPLIEGSTPLYLIQSFNANSGKTHLCKLAGQIMLNKPPTASNWSNWNHEQEREIDAILASNPDFVWLENLSAGMMLDQSRLYTILTAGLSPVAVRVGKEQREYAIRQTWVATGLDTDLTDEGSRRICLIRLRKPHGWRWKYEDVVIWASRHRAEILAVLFDCATAWINDCDAVPKATTDPLLDSYQKWMRIVGGTVIHTLGFDEFMAPGVRALSKESQAMHSLVAAWRQQLPQGHVGARELEALARNHELWDLLPDSKNVDPVKSIGRKISMYAKKETAFGNYRIGAALGRMGSAGYYLTVVDSSVPEGEATVLQFPTGGFGQVSKE